jgi:hypothetical protein
MDDVIVCHLIDNVPMASIYGRHSRYSTLSYCAGSRNKVAKILVNGLLFNAFENLEHALNCARSYWSQKSQNDPEHLLIWVDQVCINQADNREKSLQVAMMREIFQGCGQVFACLSSKCSSSPITNITNLPVKTCQNCLAKHSPDELLTQPPSYQYQMNSDEADHKSMVPATVGGNDPWLVPGLVFLRDMLSAAWWTRAWVFQEVMLPSRVFLLYDKFSGPWPEVAPILSCFCRHQNTIIQNISAKTKPLPPAPRSRDRQMRESPTRRRSKQSRPWPEVAPILSYFYQHQNTIIQNISAKTEPLPPAPRSRDRQMRESPTRRQPKQSRPSHEEVRAKDSLESLLKELHKMKSDNTWASAEHVLRAKMTWTGSSDLRTVAENLHRFSATDPRDVVYAFLGLIGPDCGIEPDYGPQTTLHHVLISVAQSLIRQENRLDILEDALRRSGELGFHLPGWVPDWTVLKSASLKLPPEMRQHAGRFRASRAKYADASFHENARDRKHIHLGVTGILADVLTQIQHNAYGEERYFMSQQGRLIITSASAQLLDTVWVLHGADSVFVLREQSTNCYALISTAFILDTTRGDGLSSIMHDELVDREDRGEVQARSIRIT